MIRPSIITTLIVMLSGCGVTDFYMDETNLEKNTSIIVVETHFGSVKVKEGDPCTSDNWRSVTIDDDLTMKHGVRIHARPAKKISIKNNWSLTSGGMHYDCQTVSAFVPEEGKNYYYQPLMMVAIKKCSVGLATVELYSDEELKSNPAEYADEYIKKTLTNNIYLDQYNCDNNLK